MDSSNDFKKWYIATLNEKLEDIQSARKSFWSKAIAVGNENWLISETTNMKIKRFKVFKGDKESFFIGKVQKSLF